VIKEQGRAEWKEVKTKIKNKFSKLSDSDIDGLDGNMDRLTSKVQKAYSYDQSTAEQECKEFNETLKM
jgi:uncharacterized protein YjbJ (UPF0337 family)